MPYGITFSVCCSNIADMYEFLLRQLLHGVRYLPMPQRIRAERLAVGTLALVLLLDLRRSKKHIRHTS